MNIEYLKALLGKGKDAVDSGRSLLQMLEIQVEKSKDKLTDEELGHIEAAIEDTKKASEAVESLLEENEKDISVIQGVPLEVLQALRQEVKAECIRFKCKLVHLDNIKNYTSRMIEKLAQFALAKQQEYMDRIQKQREFLQTLEPTLLELDMEQTAEAEMVTSRTAALPRMVFHPSTPLTGMTAHENAFDRNNWNTLKIHSNSSKDVSRESGISEAISSDCISLGDGNAC